MRKLKFILKNQPAGLSWIVNAGSKAGRLTTIPASNLDQHSLSKERARCILKVHIKSLLGAGNLLDSSVKLKVS